MQALRETTMMEQKILRHNICQGLEEHDQKCRKKRDDEAESEPLHHPQRESRLVSWKAQVFQMRGPRSKAAISASEITGLCSSAINMSLLN